MLSLWFCFCLHCFVFDISTLLSYIQNNFSYELARPIMGTIFLVLLILINCAAECLDCRKGEAIHRMRKSIKSAEHIYGQTRLHYPARLRARVIITTTTRWEVVKISASPKRPFLISCHFSIFPVFSRVFPVQDRLIFLDAERGRACA